MWVRTAATSGRSVSRSMTKAYRALVSGTATWMRKSSPPETTKTPTVSGRPAAKSRNASIRWGGGANPDGAPVLHGAAEGRQVDVGVVAPDHTAGAQRPDPFQGGGRGDAD